MTRSEAAKARGQTGFLKRLRTYRVDVECETMSLVKHFGHTKKDAWREARRWLKTAHDPHSPWLGWMVFLSIDGRRVPATLIAANLHAPKGL